jgi:hypothetical protein
MRDDYINSLPGEAKTIAEKMLADDPANLTNGKHDKDWQKLSQLAPGVDHNIIHDINTTLDKVGTGSDIYQSIVVDFQQGRRDPLQRTSSGGFKGDQNASLALKEAGINGIQYLDGSSRGKGEGSYNYVIFDDAAIQIMETFYQGEGGTAKGGITFLQDGRAIIHAFEGADVSTIVHEIGHIFRRDLSVRDLKIAEDWAGVKDGVWTREAEETFARGFEKYLADGSEPTAKLKAVFQKFKEWMVGIYRTIAGSAIDVNITPEMKGVFDRLLSEQPIERGTLNVGERIAEMGKETGTDFYQGTRAMAEGMKAGPKMGEIAGHPVIDYIDSMPVIERTEITIGKKDYRLSVVSKYAGGKGSIGDVVIEVASKKRDGSVTWKQVSSERVPADVFDAYSSLMSKAKEIDNLQKPVSIADGWMKNIYEKDIRLTSAGARVYSIGDMVRLGDKTQATITEVRADGSLMLDSGKVVSSAAVSLVAAQANMLGDFGMRARPDAVQSSMLFQSADPKMPLGGIDQASGFKPEGAILDETYSAHVKPLLDAMREQAMKGDQQKFNFADLTPEAQSALNAYVKQVTKQDMPGTKLATVRYGEGMRDFAMLNYSKKYGFDKYILDPIVPYQFFTTRSGMNWLIRVVDKPALYSNFLRLNRFTSKYERDLPDRLKGKMQISAPWLPEWMGGSVFIDPLKQMFPPLMWLAPFEQMARDKSGQAFEAERVLQEWAQDEKYTVAEINAAQQTKSGPIYEAAMAEATLRRKAEIANPLDFMSTLLGPALYLTVPWKMLTGKANEISQLPITRTGQAIETATKGTWAEPLGMVAGLLAKPEQWLRQKAGLPELGEYGDYYIKRQIANMVAEGLATTEEGTTAIYEGKGPVYDQAVERVRQELMMKVPLASALSAGLKNGPLAAAQAFPSSLFGAGILPEGELKYRGLFESWGAVWESRDKLLVKFNGDEAAVKAYLKANPEEDLLTKFFDDHPEYEVYLLSKKDDPEAQLKKMLTGQIWDSYMGLDKATRRIVTAQLGPLFQRSFLNSETRSPDSLDMETLAHWSMMLGNKVPETKSTEGALNVPAYQQTQLEGLPTGTAGAMAAYDAAKAAQFPYMTELQNLYFSSSDADQARILTIYPQIKEYWDWRREYMTQHPEVAPFLDKKTADGIIDGTLNAQDYGMSQDQAERLITYYNTEYQTPVYTADYYLENASTILMQALSAYQLMGTQLGEGSYKELQMIWTDYGKPGESFDDWLNNIIYPTLGY